MGTTASSTFTATAPTGAHFDFDTVKTDRGQKDLGKVPILVWDNLDAAIQYYGSEGIQNVLDGTSLRVSFQATARRLKLQGKSDDEIAKAELDFRPGKRQGGVSTPASKASNAAKKAAEKVNGNAMAEFLSKIADGTLDFAKLAADAGITTSLEVPGEEEDEDEAEVEAAAGTTE